MLDRKYERESTYNDTMTRVLGREGAHGGKIYLYSSQTLNFKVRVRVEVGGVRDKDRDVFYSVRVGDMYYRVRGPRGKIPSLFLSNSQL
jgi:hypothetical protein